MIFGVVWPSAKLEVDSYAMQNTSDGLNVEGIAWNSHFTELRVSITNPTNADYDDVDLVIRPDFPIREAVIAHHSPFCSLEPNRLGTIKTTRVKKGGTTNYNIFWKGGEIDIHDSQGGEYHDLAYVSGYRLRCSTFPRNSSVNVVFAAVQLLKEVVDRTSAIPPPREGEMSGGLSEWSGVTSDYDFFDVRPSPKSTYIYMGHSRDSGCFHFR